MQIEMRFWHVAKEATSQSASPLLAAARFSAIHGPKMATNVSVIALNWPKFHLNGF